jgi:hypothetical protein
MDVQRRTRRNADTVRGVGPAVTIEPPAEVRAGARPYQISSSRLNRAKFFQRDDVAGKAPLNAGIVLPDRPAWQQGSVTGCNKFLERVFVDGVFRARNIIDDKSSCLFDPSSKGVFAHNLHFRYPIYLPAKFLLYEWSDTKNFCFSIFIKCLCDVPGARFSLKIGAVQP